jgi:hypothetical protein
MMDAQEKKEVHERNPWFIQTRKEKNTSTNMGRVTSTGTPMALSWFRPGGGMSGAFGAISSARSSLSRKKVSPSGTGK